MNYNWQEVITPTIYMKYFFLFMFFFSFYPLLNKDVDKIERIYMICFVSTLTLSMLILSLYYNVGHKYSHNLFWIFYILSIFITESFAGNLFMLVLSLLIAFSWYIFSICPFALTYNTQQQKPLYILCIHFITYYLYFYIGYLVAMLFT